MQDGQIPHDIALKGSYFGNNRRAKVLLFIFMTKIISPFQTRDPSKCPRFHFF